MSTKPVPTPTQDDSSAPRYEIKVNQHPTPGYGYYIAHCEDLTDLVGEGEEPYRAAENLLEIISQEYEYLKTDAANPTTQLSSGDRALLKRLHHFNTGREE